MKSKDLLVNREGKVGTIIINRASRMNSIDLAVAEEFDRILKAWKEDNDVRCVIVTGSGRAFSAGIDMETLKAVQDFSPYDVYVEVCKTSNLIFNTLKVFPKPIIAAINGIALGFGLNLALACDLRVASDNSKMGEVFVQIGLTVDSGGSYFLPRLVGLSKALELFFTGDVISAKEAKEIGLVNMVFQKEDFKLAALEFAKKIADQPPIAIQFLKASVYRNLESGLENALDFESLTQAMAIQTEEHRRAVNKLLKKKDRKKALRF